MHTKNIIHIIVAVTALSIAGCAKKDDAIVSARYSSYFSNPPSFEIVDISIKEGGEITGIIKSSDERLKDKSVYLDAVVTIKSGDIKITQAEAYLHVKDGVGKIDLSFYASSKDKEKIQKGKNLTAEWNLRGWGELFPGIIK